MIRRELFALRNTKVVGEMVDEHNQFMPHPLIKCGLIKQSGGPKRIRTSGLCLRRAALYPAELWDHARSVVWRMARRVQSLLTKSAL